MKRSKTSQTGVTLIKPKNMPTTDIFCNLSIGLVYSTLEIGICLPKEQEQGYRCENNLGYSCEAQLLLFTVSKHAMLCKTRLTNNNRCFQNWLLLLSFYASMLVQRVKHENSPTKTMLRAIYGQASKSVGYKTYLAMIKLQAAILCTVKFPFWCENSAWYTITYMYCFYHAIFFTPMLIWSSVCRYVVDCF